jgi:hypothetical protein
MNVLKTVAASVVISVGVLVAVQASASGVGVAAMHPASRTTAAADPSTYEAPNPDEIIATGRLRSALSSAFPSQYAGISLADNNATIDVYMTSTPSNFTDVVNSATPPAGSVHEVTVANSLATLSAAQASVGDDLSSLAAQGVDVVSYGTDIPDNTEVVQVASPTSAQVATVEQEFGAGVVTVQGDSSADGHELDCHSSRDNDCTNFYGADNISDGGVGNDEVLIYVTCSTSFWHRGLGY